MKNPMQKKNTRVLIGDLWELQKTFMKALEKTAMNYGLSLPQLITLMTLSQQLDFQMMQKTMQQETNLPKSTLSYAVHQLADLKFLKRTQLDENRREVLLTLSSSGKKFIEEIQNNEQSSLTIFYQAIHSLTTHQKKELKNLLKQISDHVHS